MWRQSRMRLFETPPRASPAKRLWHRLILDQRHASRLIVSRATSDGRPAGVRVSRATTDLYGRVHLIREGQLAIACHPPRFGAAGEQVT